MSFDQEDGKKRTNRYGGIVRVLCDLVGGQNSKKPDGPEEARRKRARALRRELITEAPMSRSSTTHKNNIYNERVAFEFTCLE